MAQLRSLIPWLGLAAVAGGHLVASAAGCHLVVGADEFQIESDGQGAAGTTSSTGNGGTTTTSSGAQGGSVTTGGGGSTGGTTTSVTTASGGTGGSTGAGGAVNPCATEADCTMCVDCAHWTPACNPIYDACYSDSNCRALLQCMFACGFVCAGSCIGTYPDGLALFDPLFDCVVCDYCYGQCGSPASMCG